MAVDIDSLPLNKQITRRLVKPDTWVLNCYDPDQMTPAPFVAVGDDYALVVDPTLTKFNIRRYIEDYVTDKPLMVVCTHSHHDHTLDNWQFEDCPIYMSQTAWDEIEARKLMSDEEGMWFGFPRGNYVPHILKAGDTLDLGGRIIEVLPYEGYHSMGSLLFLDRKYGVLFTGDELECGQMMVADSLDPEACVEKFRDELKKIRTGYQFDTLCPSHNGAPISAKFIDYIIENCEKIMSGEITGDMDVGSISFIYNPYEKRPESFIRAMQDDPTILRSEWMGSSVIYRTDRILRSQLEK